MKNLQTKEVDAFTLWTKNTVIIPDWCENMNAELQTRGVEKWNRAIQSMLRAGPPTSSLRPGEQREMLIFELNRFKFHHEGTPGPAHCHEFLESQNCVPGGIEGALALIALPSYQRPHAGFIYSPYHDEYLSYEQKYRAIEIYSFQGKRRETKGEIELGVIHINPHWGTYFLIGFI